MRIPSLSPPARALVPIVALVVLLAVLLAGSAGRRPVIDAADPRIGRGGDPLIVTGRNFGAERNGGYVEIAGVTPRSNAYLEWSDSRISVRVPREVRSGFVHVVVGGNRSNGVLFANRDFLPAVVTGPAAAGQPLIAATDKSRAAVGELVVISGKHFGLQRGTSAVLFTWLAGDPVLPGVGEPGVIAADEYDLDYESWSDTEIRVRVPDGAATGNVVVRTDKGLSNEVFFEVSSNVGSKRYAARRTYSVRVDSSVANIRAVRPNELYLWVPRVWQSPAQRNVRLVYREPEPLYDNVAGVTVYHFSDLVPGGVYDVTQHFIFERYAIETVVASGRVAEYDTAARAYRTFTAADALVPADHQQVTALAERLSRGRSNPWQRARAIYDGVLARLTYRAQGASDPAAALSEGIGNAYDFALLYTALLRAAGVPARPIAGYVVESPERVHAHFWAEFYLHRFGWVPVDPALGAGAPLVGLENDLDPAEFYFGNLDNRHLALSKGVLATGKIDPAGRTVRRSHLGTLQLHHEEAVGGLTSYSARWNGISILGVY